MRPMHSSSPERGAGEGEATTGTSRLCRWTLIKSGCCSNRSAKIFVQILKLCFCLFIYLFYFFLSLFFLLSSLPLGSSRLHFSETDITNPFQAKLRDWALSRTIYQPGFSCSGRGLGLKLKPRRRRRRQRIPCQLGFLGNRDFSLVARRHARLIASPSKADHKKANL